MELYDIETNTQVYEQGVYLAEAVGEEPSADAVVKEVHKISKEYIKRNKFVTLIGGEHTISIGSIRAFNECFDNLSVLHLDAHANLRKSVNGSSLNHACALHEASQTTNLIQVGIRSMDAMEMTFTDADKIFFAHDMVNDEFWTDKVLDLLTNNVFITLDVSALDLTIMPSAVTPEPGGLFWYETLDFLKQVFEEKNVVGFDMTGLCPNPQHKSADVVAARLFYKMLSYKFSGEMVTDDYDNTYDKEYKSGSGITGKFEDDD